jgi:hypothetical protein
MKTFKSIDLFIQLLLLALMVVAYFINDPEKLSPILIVLVFAAVQIISILANLGAGPRPWKKTSWRKFHLIGTALVIIIVIVALIQDSSRTTGDKEDKYAMPGLGTMLFATIPAMLLALFYTVITWFEWMKMKKTVTNA